MRTGLQGHSILIVEDEPLIALDLRQTIEKAGAHVFAATQLPYALRLADHPDLSVAVLDYRLGHEDVGPLRQRLEQRGIPFIFYSGYADALERWPNAILVPKPSPEHSIITALSAALERSVIDARPITARQAASA
jgi:CheY-like chemotaxis protein